MQRVHLYVKGYIISQARWIVEKRIRTYGAVSYMYIFEKSKCMRTENRTKNSFCSVPTFFMSTTVYLLLFWELCGEHVFCGSHAWMHGCMRGPCPETIWPNLKGLSHEIFATLFCLIASFHILCASGVVSTYCQVLLELNWKHLLLSIFENREQSQTCSFLKVYYNQMDMSLKI